MVSGPGWSTPRRIDDRVDPQDIESLVLVCLENLAEIAHANGERDHAARLLEAADVLRVPVSTTSTGLTRREWDVARLVAQGASNRQIARQLVISERTVDTHVTHILRKLRVASRAQIAAWVVGQQRHLMVVT